MALLHRRSTSKRASQKMWENNAAMPDDASANDNVSSARPEPAAFVPTPFDEVIDISDLVAERRRLQRNLWAMRIITIVLLIAAIAVACFPLALQFESDRNLAATTATTAKEVAGWPYPQAEDKLTAARAYNKKLAESGQPILGEAAPYRMPTSKSVLRHTWEKGAQYLKKMGGIIMIASIIIWFLGYYPNHSSYQTTAEQQENSYIGQIGKSIEPIIKPLGFDWKMGVGLLSGVGAKELVVSTLGVLYTNDGNLDDDALPERIAQQSDITPLIAFAYMLFTLLYFPCIATLAAIRQETGSWKWPLFAACYTTVLAWIVAFLVYQIGSFII